ncbi:hypothetical protein [Paraburkholderia dipogonis]|uniref:hypothetical protein n=1 Tax=Paraburkholderia dipogonis TaxID=1211383 RepID=UPI0038BDFF0A
MKSDVANTILGTPINWLHRAIRRRRSSDNALYPAKILRVAIIASILYFAVAMLAIAMAILLAIADAIRCVLLF